MLFSTIIETVMYRHQTISNLIMFKSYRDMIRLSSALSMVWNRMEQFYRISRTVLKYLNGIKSQAEVSCAGIFNHGIFKDINCPSVSHIDYHDFRLHSKALTLSACLSSLRAINQIEAPVRATLHPMLCTVYSTLYSDAPVKIHSH